MPTDAVPENEIEAAEELTGQGEYSRALILAQNMLGRADDVETRIRLLYSVVSCSAHLGLDSLLEDALQALGRLPDSMTTRMYADYLRALAHLDLNRPLKALELIEANLNSRA